MCSPVYRLPVFQDLRTGCQYSRTYALSFTGCQYSRTYALSFTGCQYSMTYALSSASCTLRLTQARYPTAASASECGGFSPFSHFVASASDYHDVLSRLLVVKQARNAVAHRAKASCQEESRSSRSQAKRHMPWTGISHMMSGERPAAARSHQRSSQSKRERSHRNQRVNCRIRNNRCLIS